MKTKLIMSELRTDSLIKSKELEEDKDKGAIFEFRAIRAL